MVTTVSRIADNPSNQPVIVRALFLVHMLQCNYSPLGKHSYCNAFDLANQLISANLYQALSLIFVILFHQVLFLVIRLPGQTKETTKYHFHFLFHPKVSNYNYI